MTIEGMMCEHCEKTVKRALESIDGVTHALADHEKNRAVISLEKPVPDDILTEAVEAEDYHVTQIASGSFGEEAGGVC